MLDYEYIYYLDMIKKSTVDVRPSATGQLSISSVIEEILEGPHDRPEVDRARTSCSCQNKNRRKKCTCPKESSAETEHSMIPILIPKGQRTPTYIFMLSIGIKTMPLEQANCILLRMFIKDKFPQAYPFWTTHIRRCLRSSNIFEFFLDAKKGTKIERTLFRIKQNINEKNDLDMAFFLEKHPNELKRLWKFRDLRHIIEMLANIDVYHYHKFRNQVYNLKLQGDINTANTVVPEFKIGDSVSEGEATTSFGGSPTLPTNNPKRRLFESAHSGSRYEQYNKINKKFRKHK